MLLHASWNDISHVCLLSATMALQHDNQGHDWLNFFKKKNRSKNEKSIEEYLAGEGRAESIGLENILLNGHSNRGSSISCRESLGCSYSFLKLPVLMWFPAKSVFWLAYGERKGITEQWIALIFLKNQCSNYNLYHLSRSTWWSSDANLIKVQYCNACMYINILERLTKNK